MFKRIFVHWPLFAIVFVALVFFYPTWLRGNLPLPLDALVGVHVPWTEIKWDDYPTGVPIKNLEITDSISQFYPWRTFVGEAWRKGEIPLWNPYMFSGTPFLATLHSAALYPLNVFYLFFPDHIAWSLLVFLQLTLAGVFMYIFLRTLDIKKRASFLGGVAFSFSGYMVAWIEFSTGGQAGLWLPLLLAFEYKLLKSGRFLWFLLIPFIFFLIFTAGDFQVPLYIVMTYFLFGLYLVKQQGLSLSSSFEQVIIISSSFLFGVLISLPQLLPSIDLLRQSMRPDDAYIQKYFYGLMDWIKVTNFFWPDFYGNVTTGNYWGRFGFHEYMSFTGVVAVVFSVFSFFRNKSSTEKFFWFLLLVSLLFLFPTPLGFLPFQLHLPALSTSSASRIIFVVDFCLAALAAYGFSKWEEKHDKAFLRILPLFLAITAIVAGSLAYFIYGASNISSAMLVNLKVALKNMVPTTTVLVFLYLIFLIENKFYLKAIKHQPISFRPLLTLVILLVATGELLFFAWKNTPFAPSQFLYPSTKIIDFLQQQPKPFRIAGGIPTNLFMPYKLESAEGYDSLYPLQYAQWLSAVNSGKLTDPTRRYGLIHNYSSPLLNYANVEYIIDYKRGPSGEVNKDGDFYSSLKPPRYSPVFSEGRVAIFKNNQNLPRVWLTTDYKVIPESSKLIEELINLKTRGEGVIILESDPEVEVGRDRLSYEVKDFAQEYNQIKVDVSSSEDALLFLSQTFFPNWRAYLDGEEHPIYKANYNFQAITFPKGDHKVEFIYEPKIYKNSLMIGLSSIIVLLALAGMSILKKRI